MTLRIEHTEKEGTLLHGTSRGDGAGQVVKALGWRWGRSIDAWYLPRSRDAAPRRPLIELTAARLRFRPILMTSLAFILGVFPLFISTGAGANARHAIGTGVIGGMLFATVFGLLLVPVFYVVVRRIAGDKLD